jgi:hypothetical protein
MPLEIENNSLRKKISNYFTQNNKGHNKVLKYRINHGINHGINCAIYSF